MGFYLYSVVKTFAPLFRDAFPLELPIGLNRYKLFLQQLFQFFSIAFTKKEKIICARKYSGVKIDFVFILPPVLGNFNMVDDSGNAVIHRAMEAYSSISWFLSALA